MEAAAREAGALTRSFFGRDYEKWSKGSAGPVTEVDLAVDQLLKERLAGARPDYGWLSEETPDNEERLRRSHVFISDPIDGTEAFIKALPQYTISIGLAVNGRAALGVIYNPQTDELWMGGGGLPATLNGRPARASARASLDGASMIGRSQTFGDKRWTTPWPAMEFVWRHSIAYRLALVASGDADATILFGFKNEWDIAAGIAILDAAGGLSTETAGGPLLFNRPEPKVLGVVASGALLHPLLIERVKNIPHPKDWRPDGWKVPAMEGT